MENNVHYSCLPQYYNSLNSYLKRKYDEKVLKICLDGGFSCPNRDGSVGFGGCIFCNERGAGEYLNDSLTITEQFNRAVCSAEKKRKGKKFIAYFQNYTGTYDSVESLRKKYYEATQDSRVIVLAIATRPDCINQGIIDLLKEVKYNRGIDIWIELGLQTIHDRTAKLINRCYRTEVFFEAISQLRQNDIDVIVHLMMGLPGETEVDMLQTVKKMAVIDIQGIKFHCVNVMKNTDLEKLFLSGKYIPLNLEKYIDILSESIMWLPPHIVVHRLISDCNPNYLVAPLWASDKYLMLTEITRKFSKYGIYQGKYWGFSHTYLANQG